jgi:hypothetical protein
VPRLCKLYPGICLTTEEKAKKNLSHGSICISGVMPALIQLLKQKSRSKKIKENNHRSPQEIITFVFIS